MIISILKSLVFGIIEGLTEFLPISSTGHLILLNTFLKISENKDFTNVFEVFIQSGAILAVIFIYFYRLWPIKKNLKFDKDKINLWIFIIIATLPAVIFGYFFKDFISEKLFNPLTVCITLITYGLILIIIEKPGLLNFKNNSDELVTTKISNLNFLKALLIGLFQVLAMIPGTSRSAATIIGGIIVGLAREDAAEFSFFLAIPTIIGASLFSLLSAKIDLSLEQIIMLFTGFVSSFFIALLVIKSFIKYIQKNNFSLFGWYRIILAIVVILILVL